MLNLWMRPTLAEEGIDKWTFGQVMALLVIIAPVITAIEGYAKGRLSFSSKCAMGRPADLRPVAMTHNFKTNNHIADIVDDIEFVQMDSRAPSMLELVTKPTFKPEDFLTPHPTNDYYNNRFSFPILVYSALCSTAVVSGLLLSALRTQDIRPTDIINPYDSASFRFLLVPPLPVLIGYLGFCILLSIVFEIRTPEGKAYRRWCRTLHFVVFAGILLLPSFSYTFVLFLSFIMTAIYFCMSIVHSARRYIAKKSA
jgi:hypothetical protein